MASKDVRNYFKKKEASKDASTPAVPPLLAPTPTGNIRAAEMDMVHDEVQAAFQPRKHYNKKIPR